MGKNVERLGRLQLNRMSFGVVIMQNVQAVQRTSVDAAFESVSANVGKVMHTEGFGGALGEAIDKNLTDLIADLDEVSAYHKELGKLVGLADQAMHETATGVAGLPAPELTSDQQDTVKTASETNSPVQVAPGVMMTSAEAKQYYLDQAEAEQEEAARKMTVALDTRLQELIDQMPVSKYDPPKPSTEDPTGGDGTGDGSSNYGGVSGGTDGTGSGTGSGGGGGQYIGPEGTGTDPRPPHYQVVDPRPPHYYVDPPYRPPYDPPYNPNDPPNVDGGGDGTVPGGPGGPGGPRVVSPGGPLTGGVGGPTPGGVGGLVGGAGIGGAALAGGLRAGGLGAMGGLNSMSAAAGAAGGPGGAGASGAVAQSAAGGRGGMMAGGGAAGGGSGDKRKRRRGQDLFAFSVDPEEDGVEPDLGAAGSAGSSTSDGREELGW
ncbi:hypothetical protein ACUOFU_05960 [Microbacterium arabinogalactanolyticum]|uniref:hypothetical protein n=1 Tax=Microbacterium arabinogalactanolyticum TaxID=69365 RepID=UPI00404481FF